MTTTTTDYLIRVDGVLTPCAPENGTHYQLAQLYRMLDCELVEVIDLRDGRILICDEESKCKAEEFIEVNVKATRLAKHVLFPGDFIAGAAILCGTEKLR
jgi:hypothetical protein